ELALADPLLAVRILAAAGRRGTGRFATPARTVTAALVHLGIEPFFAAVEGAPVLEEGLADEPRALAGALRELARSRHSARIAAGFAMHRQDEDVGALQLAALVHRVGALQLWHQAPAAALAIRELQSQGLPAQRAQQEVLGLTLPALSAALLRAWEVAPALGELACAQPARSAAQRTVAVAVRMADRLESGWSHPALVADLAEAGVLLNVAPRAVAQLVRHVS
ncbi:HDOD domain-containing protein, partial [Ramlibacter alkalitolerans]